MNKTAKLGDIAARKKLIRLRSDLMNARARWKKNVHDNCITHRSIKGKTSRSPQKILFISVAGKWSNEMEREMKIFKSRISRLKYLGASKPKSLWIPTIIINPKIIHLKIYRATSVREVTKSQAIYFARQKAKFEGEIPDCAIYKIRNTSSRSYKLRVTSRNGSVNYVGFSEWAVGLCKSEATQPTLKKGDGGKSLYSNNKCSDAICVSGHSALFAA